MANADIVLNTSQPIVVVEPTAAEASVPSEPTIAVSIYCTAVCITCSAMVGHARLHIRAKVANDSLCLCIFISKSHILSNLTENGNSLDYLIIRRSALIQAE